MQAQTTQ